MTITKELFSITAEAVKGYQIGYIAQTAKKVLGNPNISISVEQAVYTEQTLVEKVKELIFGESELKEAEESLKQLESYIKQHASLINRVKHIAETYEQQFGEIPLQLQKALSTIRYAENKISIAVTKLNEAKLVLNEIKEKGVSEEVFEKLKKFAILEDDIKELNKSLARVSEQLEDLVNTYGASLPLQLKIDIDGVVDDVKTVTSIQVQNLEPYFKAFKAIREKIEEALSKGGDSITIEIDTYNNPDNLTKFINDLAMYLNKLEKDLANTYVKGKLTIRLVDKSGNKVYKLTFDNIDPDKIDSSTFMTAKTELALAYKTIHESKNKVVHILNENKQVLVGKAGSSIDDSVVNIGQLKEGAKSLIDKTAEFIKDIIDDPKVFAETYAIYAWLVILAFVGYKLSRKIFVKEQYIDPMYETIQTTILGSYQTLISTEQADESAMFGSKALIAFLLSTGIIIGLGAMIGLATKRLAILGLGLFVLGIIAYALNVKLTKDIQGQKAEEIQQKLTDAVNQIVEGKAQNINQLISTAEIKEIFANMDVGSSLLLAFLAGVVTAIGLVLIIRNLRQYIAKSGQTDKASILQKGIIAGRLNASSRNVQTILRTFAG